MTNEQFQIEREKFKRYFMEFYNPENGIYPMAGLTEDIFWYCFRHYMFDLEFYREKFEGDSLDRERLRDICQRYINNRQN